MHVLIMQIWGVSQTRRKGGRKEGALIFFNVEPNISQCVALHLPLNLGQSLYNFPSVPESIKSLDKERTELKICFLIQWLISC